MLECIYTSRKVATDAIIPSGSSDAFLMQWLPWYETFYIRCRYSTFRLFHDGTVAVFSKGGLTYPLNLGGLDGPDLYAVVYQSNGPSGYGMYAMELDRMTLLSDPVYGRHYVTWRLTSFASTWGQKSYPYLDRQRGWALFARDPWGQDPGLYVMDLSNPTVEVGRVVIPWVGSVLAYDRLRILHVSDEVVALVENHWQAASTRNLRLALVNYVRRELLLNTSVDPAYGVGIDHVHQLAVALSADRRVRVYALTPAPYSLSKPQFDRDPTVGDPVRVAVRLTGSNGEPCAGWTVSWTLTNGNGLLYPTRTRTGADGYASAWYVGTRQADETIVAEVVY